MCHKYVMIDQADQSLLGAVEIGHQGKLAGVFDADVGQRFRLWQILPRCLLLIQDVHTVLGRESNRALCLLLHEDEVCASAESLLPSDLV